MFHAAFYIFILKLQKKFHRTWTTIKPFHHVYKGVIWCSLPRDAASYALDFIRKKPSFLRNLSHVSIPEEFFFQTIFMNSDFKNNVETFTTIKSQDPTNYEFSLTEQSLSEQNLAHPLRARHYTRCLHVTSLWYYETFGFGIILSLQMRKWSL